MISEWWIGKDMERSGRGLFEVLSRHFPGGTEENNEISVTRAGILAEIWTRDLPNTKQ
jgi:hypothetical protein